MSWLNDHIDEMSSLCYKEHSRALHPTEVRVPLGYFEQEELTVMKNAWRSIKRQADGKTILLPGRDVWCFEVLARREDYPTLFVPECSRMTVAHLAKEHPEWQDLFLFDTGFAGSIPRAIESKSWGLLSHGALNSDKQVFPRLFLVIRKEGSMGLIQRRNWELTNVVCERRPKMAMPELAPSWLVQLESAEYPETVVVEVIEHARDEIEAAWFAFQTRNIPDNWVVTEVEKA